LKEIIFQENWREKYNVRSWFFLLQPPINSELWN